MVDAYITKSEEAREKAYHLAHVLSDALRDQVKADRIRETLGEIDYRAVTDAVEAYRETDDMFKTIIDEPERAGKEA